MCDQDDDDTFADGKKGDQSDTAYTDLLMQPKFTGLYSIVSRNQKYPQALRGGFEKNDGVHFNIGTLHFVLHSAYHVSLIRPRGFSSQVKMLMKVQLVNW